MAGDARVSFKDAAGRESEAGLVLRNARGRSVLADTAAVPGDPSTRLPGPETSPGRQRAGRCLTA